MSGPMDGQNVLVTGGAGFIGSHLVRHLLEAGVGVTVVDDLSTGSLKNLDESIGAHSDRLEIIESDFAAWAATSSGRRRFSQIYHLAAAVGVRLVVDDPIRTIETNIHQTSAALKLALENRTPLLLASTSEVYGKGVKSPFSEDDDMIYGPTSRSRWSYACSKAIDEYLALANHRDNGLPVCVVRFFNTVGPRQVGTYGMVMPRFIERALCGKPIEVFGDGTQSRCFVDVRDVVPALPRLLARSECHGRVFNIGNDQPITIGDLAELVRDETDSASEVVLVPYEDAYADGFEDLMVRVPDLSRVREAIGFEPATPLRQTVLDIASSMSTAGTCDG